MINNTKKQWVLPPPVSDHVERGTDVPNEPDWETGDGVIDIRDPAEIDAALDRGERHVGTAVIGMVPHGDDVAVIAPRVERAMRSPDPKVRELGFVAAGDMARLYTTLSPGSAPYCVRKARWRG
ncbi:MULTISPECIES: hypothetical protein [unclassified Streptomyces]|uniref:hypothetical protein n=1 Tax=unclassified Streptomyces TaxID=2593676 RepID=UPI000376BF19|nr:MULTISPECIES: hypothetical protein [unclassified Streptomyces]